MISKYLSDLGIKEENIPWNWNLDDQRQPEWIKTREIFGFDERDTWNLNYTFALLIYPRLKMYNDCNCINTSFHKFEFEGQEYTQQQCMNKILEGFEIYLIKDELKLTEEDYKKIQDSLTLLGIIWWSLWW